MKRGCLSSVPAQLSKSPVVRGMPTLIVPADLVDSVLNSGRPDRTTPSDSGSSQDGRLTSTTQERSANE